MKLYEKYCTLVFDEMALQPWLYYNQKLDLVEGFENYGSTERKASVADHALVFMLRGIYKNRKQPVAFSSCKGTTPTVVLARLIKYVIQQIKRIGLKIVCPVCDQGATNQAAIRSLMKSTDEYCKRQKIKNRYYDVLIDGDEIVPWYDFPHLLKGVGNNLLTNELHFTVDGIHKVASWNHIVRFYYSDKEDHELRLCPKLTDFHVPEKIKKMKVSCAPRVFNQRNG